MTGAAARSCSRAEGGRRSLSPGNFREDGREAVDTLNEADQMRVGVGSLEDMMVGRKLWNWLDGDITVHGREEGEFYSWIWTKGGEVVYFVAEMLSNDFGRFMFSKIHLGFGVALSTLHPV